LERMRKQAVLSKIVILHRNLYRWNEENREILSQDNLFLSPKLQT
jgi:hypothetical protein